jgi:mannose-6-phosphate isomerase-like protein (cupin superfamily)
MATISKKSFDQPDEIQAHEKLKSETITMDGLKIQRVTTEPGWRWSKHLKQVGGGDSCQIDHLIYILSGNLHVIMNDGKELEYGAGDMGVIPPGHDGWNTGNEPLVWLEIPH